jgi:hypothetical protein
MTVSRHTFSVHFPTGTRHYGTLVTVGFEKGCIVDFMYATNSMFRSNVNRGLGSVDFEKAILGPSLHASSGSKNSCERLRR